MTLAIGPEASNALRTTTKGRRSGPSSSRASVQSLYGQLDLRVTVFEVIGIPGNVGVLSESAEVPVAVAE